MQNFKDAFYFPFIKFNRVSYFLINFIPIFGTFAYLGYLFNVLKMVSMQNLNAAPKFGDFWDNVVNGFLLVSFFLFWFLLMGLFYILPFGKYLNYVLIFLFPISLNYYIKTRSIVDSMNIAMLFHTFFMSALDYILTWFKFILLLFFYLFLSVPIITIFITLHSFLLTTFYLFGDFYRYATIWEKNKQTEDEVVKLLNKIEKINKQKETKKEKQEKIDEEKLFESILCDMPIKKTLEQEKKCAEEHIAVTKRLKKNQDK